MKKVLVTGGNGFIGKPILKKLIERGYNVHATTSKQSSFELPGVNWYSINLLDISQIKNLVQSIKPEYLLHLAWEVTPITYWTSERNYDWIQASFEMLKLFYHSGGRRVVMAGTSAEYDWNYGYCSEFLTPKNPSTTYGISKNILQTILDNYSQQMGLSSAWGRIFSVYGPFEHQSRFVPSIICPLLSDKHAYCKNGGLIRDYLHVFDVADAFISLLESDVSGPVNIASGVPVTLRDIADTISGFIGKPDLLHIETSTSLNNEANLLVGDVARLSREVKWSPEITMETGIKQTINWWEKYDYKR